MTTIVELQLYLSSKEHRRESQNFAIFCSLAPRAQHLLLDQFTYPFKRRKQQPLEEKFCNLNYLDEQYLVTFENLKQDLVRQWVLNFKPHGLPHCLKILISQEFNHQGCPL